MVWVRRPSRALKCPVTSRSQLRSIISARIHSAIYCRRPLLFVTCQLNGASYWEDCLETVFPTINRFIRRYLVIFTIAHVLCAVMAPLLHAHSATPLSFSHPEQIHVHLSTAVAEIGICALTGNLRSVYTVEASDSRPSKAAKDAPPKAEVKVAYPLIASADAPSSILAVNQNPRNFISRIHLHGGLPSFCCHPQGP